MEIEDVQIAYDVSSLSNIDQKLKRAREAIHYSEKYNRKNPGKVGSVPSLTQYRGLVMDLL